MQDQEYTRLLELVAQGDKGAASALLSEARRRGDNDALRTASELLGPRAAARPYKLKRRTRNKESLDYSRALNAEQLAVVRAGSGPLLVIAGAGSGKTRTLTYRVARLLDLGTAPERVLLLTFTNKASKEMLSRVSGLIGERANRVWGGTFHHVGNRILRAHASRLGYPENYSVMDIEDVNTLIGVCLAELKLDHKRTRFPKKQVHKVISLAINLSQPIDQVITDRLPHLNRFIESIQTIARDYKARKHRMGLMDYDDLLVNWRRLFLEHDDVRLHYARHFEHVLVDEYQDTNQLQGQLVELCASEHKNLMVVGDDCQSIYSFRGAHFENILRFPERHTESKRFLLETNYRSNEEILALANLSITFNLNRFDKRLKAHRGPGMLPALVPCRDMLQQAEFVVDRVLELNEGGVPLRNMAILYRAHYQAVELQAELTRAGIPYTIRSGIRFFEQAHIKDVVAHLRLLYNPKDELSFVRTMKLYPGIGDKSAQRLWGALSEAPDPLQALLAGEHPTLKGRGATSLSQLKDLLTRTSKPEMLETPGELIGTIIDGDYKDYVQLTFRNHENRLSDLEQLANYAAQYSDLETFLNELALITSLTGEDIQEGGAPDDHLVLSTVHQAKGLEWRIVFVTSLFEGGFPTSAGMRDNATLEEERRLFYVSVTRAMDELYLTYPLSRRDRDGWHRVQRPSTFIEELESLEGAQRFERWNLSEESP